MALQYIQQIEHLLDAKYYSIASGYKGKLSRRVRPIIEVGEIQNK